MKKLILIGFVFIIACKKKHTNNSATTYKNYNMNIEKKIYYLDYYVQGIVQADLYINDIKIANGVNGNGYRELNPYLLKSGKNIIKLKMYRLGSNVIPYFVNKDQSGTGTRIRIYTTDNKEENIQKIKDFPIKPLKEPIPIYEARWEFESELPYEFEGWNKAQDLSKWDKDKLKEKVVVKFKEYRERLNSGNHQEFMHLQEFSNTQIFNSLFYTEKIRIGELNTDFFELQKGIMMPLENYTIKFYAKGKLVTLERVDPKPFVYTDVDGEEYSTYLYGQSALFAYREKPLEEDGISFYYDYVLLMIPEGSDELQIARVIQNID